MKEETALTVARPGKLATAAKILARRRRFKSVGFTIAVALRRRMAGVNQVTEAEKVVGRAMALRNDGQCFYASVDLPWIWDRPAFNWYQIAHGRLNTFLKAKCRCEANGKGDVITCEYHQSLLLDWAVEDEERNRRPEDLTGLDRLPLPEAKPGGVLDSLRLLHRHFPWCRLDTSTGEWFCMACLGRERAIDTGSMQNIFVRRHSHCGISPVENFVPPGIEDEVLEEVARRMDEAWQRGQRWADPAGAFVRNQRGKLVIP